MANVNETMIVEKIINQLNTNTEMLDKLIQKVKYLEKRQQAQAQDMMSGIQKEIQSLLPSDILYGKTEEQDVGVVDHDSHIHLNRTKLRSLKQMESAIGK